MGGDREDSRYDYRFEIRFIFNHGGFMNKIALVCVTAALLFPSQVFAATILRERPKTEEQLHLEEMEYKAEQTAVPAPEITDTPSLIANLPEDTTPRYMIHRIWITGNSFISSDDLLRKMPDIYDTASAQEPSGIALYDFRTLKAIISQPDAPQEVSARSILGLTQYLLEKYQNQGYSIYIYVPADAFEPGKELSQGILPIRVLEATVSSTDAAYYNVDNQPVEKGYLRSEQLKKWSPIQPGAAFNSRKMDEYLNLLNLNPDRYVAGVVSRGEEPNSLAVNYRVYEANPWHFFVQVDNSGTDDIQWRPRFGLINTNLLGYDDKLTVVYQTTPDKTWDEGYAIFGAYDFPIMGPKLRLNLFAGYSQFDISDPDVDFFRGNGSFYGGTLRYNALQFNDWFWDVTGTLQYEESRISNNLYNLYEDLFGLDLNTDIHMTLWGTGTELYKTSDRAESFFSAEMFGPINTSNQYQMNLARPGGAEDSFRIYYLNGRQSWYLDANKIQRVTGSARAILTDDRLVQSKMTTFGGMYTIRGYEESDTVADEGIITSLQYEYDVVRHNQVSLFGKEVEEKYRKPFLKKLAPLAFVDYGRARYEDKEPYEQNTELCSVGSGFILELGNNFTGTLYYGYPLKATEDTGSGQGRLHVGLLYRW
jgi:hemolysin activation/secretion protein